jgi:DnaJ-class molecular chaperone
MTCGSCGGSGTKPVQIYSEAERRWVTISETCLSCNGSGQR